MHVYVIYAFSLSFFETGPYYLITPLPPELRNSRNDSQFLDLLLFSLYSKTNEKKVLGNPYKFTKFKQETCEW